MGVKRRNGPSPLEHKLTYLKSIVNKKEKKKRYCFKKRNNSTNMKENGKVKIVHLENYKFLAEKDIKNFNNATGRQSDIILRNGHYVLISHINKSTGEVVVNPINSLKDKKGNYKPSRLKKIQEKTLLPIPKDKTNIKFESGVGLTSCNKNLSDNRKPHINDLTLQQTFDEDFYKEIKDFIFNNSNPNNRKIVDE